MRPSLIGALLIAVAGCGSSNDVTIQGCGATFPAPLYTRWFLEYYRKHPEVRVNYQAIGSGAGIQQLEEGLVLFGATDEPLDATRLRAIAEQLTQLEGSEVELIQFPLTAGSVAVCFNIPGVTSLKLSRRNLIDMLLGNITFWDDPALQASNPGVTLPKLHMTFIRRAESSGTTFVFTSHLSAIDPRWAEGGPGAGKSVQWPIGIGGKGNAGVNALIDQTPGAFGYLEAGYAELTKLPMAALENRQGKYVAPSAAASRAALEEARFDDVLAAAVPDPVGADAYPIVSFTWIVCRKTYADPRKAAKLKDVFHYCLHDGQKLSDQLGYVTLPPDALARARHAVSTMRADFDKRGE